MYLTPIRYHTKKIHEPENIKIETIQNEAQSAPEVTDLCELWDDKTQPTMHAVRVPGGGTRGKRSKSIS